MSYQERRSIVNVIGTILITVLYAGYMVQHYPAGSPYSVEMFRFWGAFFLILIPVSIVAKIAIHIVFSILNTIATREDEPAVTDERDNLIDLKANRYTGYVFGIGIMVAMAALVLEMSPSVMFIVLLITGVIADVIGEVMQFFFYRRGV